jgi:hypothetical protein
MFRSMPGQNTPSWRNTTSMYKHKIARTDSSKFMKWDQYLERIVILESIMWTPWDIKKEEMEKLSNFP